MTEAYQRLWVALHRVWNANLARSAYTRKEWMEIAMKAAMGEDFPPQPAGPCAQDVCPWCHQEVPRETEDPDALG